MCYFAEWDERFQKTAKTVRQADAMMEHTAAQAVFQPIPSKTERSLQEQQATEPAEAFG